MANQGKMLKSTFFRGILFLAPIIVLIILIEKAFSLTQKIVHPIVVHLPYDSIGGVRIHRIIAVFILIFICLLAGIISRTRASKRFISTLEGTILNKLPGYSFIKSVGEDFLENPEGNTQQAVLVRLDDVWLLGFKIEEIDGKLATIFLPDAPSPLSGTLTIVELDRIYPLDMPQKEVIQMFSHMGKGTAKLKIPSSEKE